MTNENPQADKEPKIIETLMDDLRHSDFKRTIRRDFKELKEFMLTDERHKRLEEMGRVKQWLYLSWWLLKSLILKLTPTRRLLLALGLLFFWMQANIGYSDHSVRINIHLLGGFILLFVLMLELKDKLLARKELEAGHAVQKALMPERTPHVPGWKLWLFSRSANEVGGDLVDFIKLTDDRFGIALGDVAGKGLRAALLTAKLQATLRALVPDFTSLSEFGVKLNQIFCRDSLPNIFASFVYLEFQPNSGVVRVVNAGHIPPVVVRGIKVEGMEKGGAALGILPEAMFVEQRIDLQVNDVLIVYSDGLTEAQSEDGEFFGEQRLLNLLPTLSRFSVEQIGERLVAEVDSFLGEARANDDLSIALLKRI